jgi:phosphoglycerol transferase MdoB-like AlkP superfamily enzyme
VSGNRSALLPGLLLAIVLVAAKTAIIWPLDFGTWQGIRDFVAVTAADCSFAIAFGAAAFLALRATAGQRVATLAWLAVLLVGAVSAAYAVANVAIYGYLHAPLNARMLAVVGRVTNVWSSVAEHTGAAVAALTVLTPIAYVVVARCRVPRLLEGRSARAALLVVLLLWAGAGAASHARLHPSQRRAAKSPHGELITSAAQAALFGRQVDLGSLGAVATLSLDDFDPAAKRRLPPIGEPPQNVVVVVLESTAASYLSLYGSPYDTTPNLAAESRHALILDRAYANAGWTYLARLPLFYGIAPGVPWQYGWEVQRPPGLAKILASERGHRTAFFSGGDPEWDGMYWAANEAGFGRVFGPVELGGRMASSWGTEDGRLIDGLIRWIDEEPERPFYALVWTDQTHHPYTLAADTRPVDFLDESASSHGQLFERYLNAIRQADHHLGRLFEAVRARGIADRTLIVVTADHGEAFGDLHEDAVSHGGALYDECLRVPMMFWNPRLFAGGRRDPRAGAHVDVLPTIAHLLGVGPPDGWQGTSFLAPDRPGRAYLTADAFDVEFGVTDGRYKYIVDVAADRERLYDLEKDARERIDLVTERPQIAAELRARVAAFIQVQQESLRRAGPFRREETHLARHGD